MPTYRTASEKKADEARADKLREIAAQKGAREAAARKARATVSRLANALENSADLTTDEFNDLRALWRGTMDEFDAAWGQP